MAFRSVFVDGKIINPQTGKAASLTFFGENAIPYMQSVSIELERGVNPQMSITMAPPYEQALALTSKDNEWFRLGNTLGLRWGYADIAGAISDWYYGFMQMPEVSYGEEISLNVNATALAWNSDRVERLRGWGSAESPISFREVAEQIAQRYGMEAVFGTLDPNVKYMVDYPQPSFVQGGRTDLQFLMFESTKLGLRLIIQNQKFIFVDQAAPLPGEPSVNATFQMYGKIDIWNNVFPLDSFDPESMGTMFIQNMQGVSAVPYGPNDDPEVEKEPIVSTDATATATAFTSQETVAAPPEKDGKPAQGIPDVKVKTVVKLDDNPYASEGGRHFALPLDGEEPQKFIEGYVAGAREAVAEEHGITASFGAVAIPNLLPSMFVRLEGIGDYFTGNYMLNKVGIKIEDGGAHMDMEGFARGFPAVNRDLDPFATMAPTYQDPKQDAWFDSLFTEVKEPTT